jgi:hypothetical protein
MAGLALVLTLGCYTDDVGGPGSGKPANPLVRVLLTDDPFPYDTLLAVNLYVVDIGASTVTPDVDSLPPFTTLAAPHKSFNLLDLQQGVTAFLGQDTLNAGQYRMIRMRIRTDSSSITWADGTPANVQWGGLGLVTIFALVDPPFTPADSGSNLVLDFDVGRSFPYNNYGTSEFDFIPWLRAVNEAETGAIDGTVTTSFTGSSQPVDGAVLQVFEGPLPQQGSILATGRTDAAGHFHVGLLPPGTYGITATLASNPALATATVTGLTVTAGHTVLQDVSLPTAGAGSAALHISGQTSLGVGGSVVLFAAVLDTNGNLVPNPAITWMSRDTAIAQSHGLGAIDSVIGRTAGSTRIVATYAGLSDSVTVQVSGGPADPVAYLTITPPSNTVAVGDSVGFYARPYDAANVELFGRPVGWFVSDSTVVRLYSFGQSALIQPLKAGTVTLQATSEGKTATATITVH